MKKKVIIVAVVWAVFSVLGGAWSRFEQYLGNRSIPLGQIEVENLKGLYDAELFNEVLGESERAEYDDQCKDFIPQIMYLKWAANRRLGRILDADEVQQRFLARFPNHVLAAEFHFSSATKMIDLADFSGAERELHLILVRFPTAAVVRRAATLLAQLEASEPTTAPAW